MNTFTNSDTTIVNEQGLFIKRPLFWIVFLIFSATYIVLSWLSQQFVYNESLYFRSYSGTLTNQTIEGILGFQSRFWWTGYVITPILLSFKILFASICISIGYVLSGIEVKFKQILKIVLLSEIVFIVAQVSLIAILFAHLDEVTLQNASGFFPLSALSLIGIENVNAQWAIYPLQTFNLFELFYMLTIAWLLSKNSKQSFTDILNIVLPSYGLGLLLWITLVAFLVFQIS